MSGPLSESTCRLTEARPGTRPSCCRTPSRNNSTTGTWASPYHEPSQESVCFCNLFAHARALGPSQNVGLDAVGGQRAGARGGEGERHCRGAGAFDPELCRESICGEDERRLTVCVAWRGSSFARPRTRRTTTSPSRRRPSGTCAACSCTPGTESPCARRSRSTRTRHSSNATAPLPTCCSSLVDSPNYLSSRPRVVTLRSLHSSVRCDDSPASRDLTRASARSTQRRRNAQSMLSMVSSSLW